MIGKAKSEVKPIFDLTNSMILQSPAALLHHAGAVRTPLLKPLQGPVGNILAGVTRMAILSLTVVHTCSHRPQPTQRLLATSRRISEKSMDNAWVGHWETQA
jgi:hypothetical protein